MENLKNILQIDFKKKSMTDQAKRGLFIEIASQHHSAEDVATFMNISISSFLHYKNEHEKLMRSNDKYARLVQYYRTEITKKSICTKCKCSECEEDISKCSECGEGIIHG